MCYGSAECEPSILCAAVRVNTGVQTEQQGQEDVN